jgi:hypothetical protein
VESCRVEIVPLPVVLKGATGKDWFERVVEVLVEDEDPEEVDEVVPLVAALI